MKFALFYEIPVPRPWTPGKEHQAYKNTLEQAVLGDRMGFHAFWTCLLYTSPSPRDGLLSRMPSSA